MKIKLSFSPDESQKAEEILADLLQQLPHSRLHRKSDKPLFMQLYLTTKHTKKADCCGKND